MMAGPVEPEQACLSPPSWRAAAAGKNCWETTMAERGLHVAEDLRLPLDLVVQKTAILARSGAGKTTAATVVEELLDAMLVRGKSAP